MSEADFYLKPKAEAFGDKIGRAYGTLIRPLLLHFSAKAFGDKISRADGTSDLAPSGRLKLIGRDFNPGQLDGIRKLAEADYYLKPKAEAFGDKMSRACGTWIGAPEIGRRKKTGLLLIH